MRRRSLVAFVCVWGTAACGDEPPPTTLLPGRACEAPADCESLRASRGYDEACTRVACEANRCVFHAANDGAACGADNACLLGGVCADRVCVGEPVPCDDGNPCTVDACDPATGACVSTPSPGEVCDDGVPCTERDACQLDGTCAGRPTPSCECTGDEDCAALAEADRCVGAFVCGADFACLPDPATVVRCDPDRDGACIVARCDPATGECAPTAHREGLPCDAPSDGCTGPGVCLGGACVGAPIACDDGDPCTADACVAGVGCVHEPETGAPCDDGDPCTGPDACHAGVCKGLGASCDDGNPCTVDVCDPESGQCSHAPSGEPCDDGDPCTLGDTCATGVCKGAPLACDDGNPCTVDGCAPDGEGGASCSHTNVVGPCDDGDPCTGGDTCLNGACVGTQALCGCETDEACADAAPDDLCVGAWRCDTSVSPGQCVPEPATVVTCPPNETACTIDQCDPATGACATRPKADGTPCDDADACTAGDVCAQGVCVGKPLDCGDGDPCTADLCVGGVCSHPVLGGSAVFLDAGFDAGLNVGWTAETTNPAVAWRVAPEGAFEGAFGLTATGPDGTYDHGGATATLRSPRFWVYGETIALRFRLKAGFAAPTEGGAACLTALDRFTVAVEHDGLVEQVACVTSDAPDWVEATVDLSVFRNREIALVFAFHSEAGGAGFGAALDEVRVTAHFTCTDGPCTIGVCETGVCLAGPQDCDDGDPCTLDLCSAVTGKCLHLVQDVCGCTSDFDCMTFSPCLTAVCGPDGFCQQTVVTGPCDDQDACTVNDACTDDGECVGEDVLCDDGLPCTDDWCDYSGECVFQFKPLACDDGDPCTTNDTCTGATTCAGQPLVCAEGPCATGTCVDGGCHFTIFHDGQFELEETFDSVAPGQLPAGWSASETGSPWAWKVTSTASHSAPNALGLSAPASGAWTATTVAVEAPATALPAAGGTLRYRVRGAWADQGCDADVLRVRVGDAVIDTVCADQPTFVERSVALDAFAAQTVAIRFEFSAAAADAGAIVLLLDDVAVTSNHPCDDGDACTTGDACWLGFCMGKAGPCP